MVAGGRPQPLAWRKSLRKKDSLLMMASKEDHEKSRVEEVGPSDFQKVYGILPAIIAAVVSIIYN